MDGKNTRYAQKNLPIGCTQYADIVRANDKKSALKAVKKSLELAEKAGNKDYVIMNKSSILD